MADADDEKSKLTIKPIENNSKDRIEQPKLSEQDIIPKINTSNIFIGATGMGKSTLISNLVTKDQFFGGKKKDGSGWFDARILISPTGDTDDVQKSLGLSDDEIITDLTLVPDFLEALMAEQKRLIKQNGADKAPKVLIMYDDVISHPRFMKDRQFIKSFIANRHHNFTVFVASQSWTKVPRAIRLQARGIFYFAGGMSEVEHLCDEYCPPGLNRHDFNNLVDYATKKPFSFLYINKSVPMKQRFRKNLGDIITTEFFKDSKRNPDFEMPEEEEDEDTSEVTDNKKAEDEGPSENFQTVDPVSAQGDRDNKKDRQLLGDIEPPPRLRQQEVHTSAQGQRHGPGRKFARGARGSKRSHIELGTTKGNENIVKRRQGHNKFRSKRLESSYHS